MTQPLAACVLTQSCFETDAALVARKVGERFAHLGVKSEVRIAQTSGAARYALDVDGVAVMVIYTGKPIAEDIVTNLAQNLLESEATPTAHRDQAVVTLLHDDVEDHEATLRAASAILKVACVLAETDAATAVYWLPSEMLMSATFFAQVMEEMRDAEDVPSGVMIRFVPYADGGGFEQRQGVAVLGLDRFIGRDIEFVPSALPLNRVIKSAFEMSDWLLRKGPVFEDGDTCGGSATEIIRIRHKDRGRISPHPVLESTIETLDPSEMMKQAPWSN